MVRLKAARTVPMRAVHLAARSGGWMVAWKADSSADCSGDLRAALRVARMAVLTAATKAVWWGYKWAACSAGQKVDRWG
jgi:hypothetical protein